MTASNPTNVEQQKIIFLNAELDVIFADGQRYMNISAICELLGLHANPQRRRIKRTPTLYAGLRMLPILTSGGEQTVSCLDIRFIGPWLGSLQIDALTEANRKKCALIQEKLVAHANATFPGASAPSIPEEAVAPPEVEHAVRPPAPPSEGTQKRTQKREIPSFPVASMKQQQLLNQLVTVPGTHLIIPSASEDAAFRESCLADEAAWNFESSAPHFTSTDKVTVYLAPPTQQLDREQAVDKIGKLGERTVMTARIALGLWNIRRHDPQLLQKNGSIPIAVEEILEWRGIAKHSREAYPGSNIREIEGFEAKYREQVYEDFTYLQHCYMYSERGIPVKFEGPYAHVTILRGQRTLWNKEDDVLGYLFAPGGWITSQTGQALSQFAIALADIFRLKPHRHQIAIRIALYLVERWSQLSLVGDYDDPIMLGDLLRASIIGIDTANARRFIARIEAGIKTLVEHGIVGKVQLYESPSETKMGVLDRFLTTYVSLPPHHEIVRKYQQLSGPTAPLLRVSSAEKRM